MRLMPTAPKARGRRVCNTKMFYGNVRMALLGGVVVVLLAGGLAWWLARPAPEIPAPEPASLPSLPRVSQQSGATQSAAAPQGPERKETLMDVGELIKQELSTVQLVSHAHRYLEGREAGPAFLLLRKAARQGSGEASFLIGQMYDPNGFGERLSPFPKARADKAYEWYMQAVKVGFGGAEEAADQVMNWLQAAADNGDEAAAASLAHLRQ